MTNLQLRINEIVEGYKTTFADEYSTFCNAISDKREIQNDDYASTGKDHALVQLAYEIPVTLYNMFDVALTPEEKKYLQSKEGAEWFGRTNKEFSPANKI